MRFIDDHQRVTRQIIEQRGRRLARLLAGEMARIIFDAAAEAHLFQHFEIEHRALMQSLRLEKFSFFDQLWLPPLQLLPNRFDRALERRARHYVMRLRIYRQPRRVFLFDFAEQRIDCRDRINLITPEFDAIRIILITWINLHDIAAHAKATTFKVDIVPFVLQLDQPLKQSFARYFHARLEKDQHAIVRIRIAKTIDARHTGDHDHIPPFKERAGRRHAQPIDFFINDCVLFNVGV